MGDDEETRALEEPVRGPVPAATSVLRDPVVDLARVACILLVVVAHLLMVGAGLDPSGRIVLSRPVEEQPWFVAATWVGQVMPLFFALGGFTAATSWRRRRALGDTAADFVRSRTLRLAAPALPLFAVVTTALVIATFAGADPALRDTIAAGIGVPLWFLAAYLLVQCLVPWLLALHERAPRGTLVALAAAAAIVDLARFATGSREVGLIDLLFVGAFVQQLGFWYADGWFGRRSRLQLAAIAVAAYALAWLGVVAGWHAPNMLTNLDPPTVSLMLLGIAQMSLLTLFHPALGRLMASRSVRAAVSFVASRALTLYLWHMPVIVVVAGATLLLPGLAPAPTDAAWWLGRPAVFALVLVVVWLISSPLARFERFVEAAPAGSRAPSTAAILVAAVLALVPLLGVILRSLDLALAAAGTVLLTAAVVLDRARPARTR
ncbi:acyltransferase [Agromyces luteolus]|uniref:acyltransferase family protein n=1 Tax=Agromyces luteolus TaxID=88373 RepID=UPI0022F341D4|nr:acyltransferase [Agromyces luteolus]GLK29116.1 acyltransferase [Agromyces luteolus]